jgi:prepilin-type N-terminal cleavage/methylation domain-containing protein
MNYKVVKNNKGFSLIELMVATSIFVVIMLAAMGALFHLLDGSKNSRALRISMDNINFAMESMTRSLRMGNRYYCTDTSELVYIMQDLNTELYNNCDHGQTAIAFFPYEGSPDRLGYKLNERTNGTQSLQRCKGSDPDSCVDIVSPDVNITHLKFFTFGSEPVDSIQAGTYIIIRGEVKVKEVDIPFSLQTMVSARNF